MSRATLLPLGLSLLAACAPEAPTAPDLAVYAYGHDTALRDRLIRGGRMLDDLGGAVVGRRDEGLASRLGVAMVDLADPAPDEVLWVVGGHVHDPAAAEITDTGRTVWRDEVEDTRLVIVPAGGPEPAFRCHGSVRAVRDVSLRPTQARTSSLRAGLLPASPVISQMVSQVSLTGMQADVDALVAFGSRRHGLAGEFQAQAFLAQRFASMGLSVDTLDYDNGADVVCAELPGLVDPDRLVIVGGHYDSVNWQDGTTAVAPGADDDASGTAAVLDIARVLSQQEGFAYTVRFCAWSGEELGLLGSDAEAERLAAEGADVVGMVQLDMVGYTPPGAPTRVEFILNDTSTALNAFARDVFAAYVPALPTTTGFLSAGSSDHRSFFERGFPAIWPFEDTSNGSPFIHTANDVVGTSINDWTKAVWMTQGALATVAELARPLSLELAHTPLVNTTDDVSPQTVTVDITPRSSASVSTVELLWRLEGAASWTTVPMQRQGTTSTWSASLPPVPSPARVAYRVQATDSAGLVTSVPADDFARETSLSYAVGVRDTVASWDFEGATDEGWTHAQTATQDDWQRGTPQGLSTDPLGAASGTGAWGNDLGPAGFNGEYQPNVDNHLESPAFDTTGRTDLRLRYRRWLGVESGQYDQARVLVNGLPVWSNPLTEDILDTTWVTEDLDLAGLADDRAVNRVRFTLTTDGGLEYGGWNLDDVEVYGLRDSVSLGAFRLLGPSAVRAGERVQVTIVGLQPGAPWALVASRSNAGAVVSGQVVEVGAPFAIVGTGRADALGQATASVRIPPTLAGQVAYLEAGTPTGGFQTTNLHTLRVE